jgi:hypothetical protein
MSIINELTKHFDIFTLLPSSEDEENIYINGIDNILLLHLICKCKNITIDIIPNIIDYILPVIRKPLPRLKTYEDRCLYKNLFSEFHDIVNGYNDISIIQSKLEYDRCMYSGRHDERIGKHFNSRQEIIDERIHSTNIYYINFRKDLLRLFPHVVMTKNEKSIITAIMDFNELII